MTAKRWAWSAATLGLLLAGAVTFVPRAGHQAAAVSPSATRVEPPPMVSGGVASHSTLTTERNSSPQTHPRTWRPSPVDAYRASERSGYAWILRQMGMSESDLDRLASGGFAALVKDLAIKADQGDRSAILSLGWLSRRCVGLRSEDQLNGYQQRQLQDGRVLPPADAAWFTSFLNQDIDTEKQRITECTAIDQDHVEALLTGLSQQGDGASTFMLAEQAGNMSDMNRLARQAALQGFPEAQYEWASDLFADSEQKFWQPQPGDPSAVEFLRRAADELPSARAALAMCEYRGCNGEIPDPQKAVADARAAAQQGATEAMANLAATAPLSLISATELQAWTLFDVALQQRGCKVSIVGVKWMKSMASRSANATPEAQALADQNWQQYGATAMQKLGC